MIRDGLTVFDLYRRCENRTRRYMFWYNFWSNLFGGQQDKTDSTFFRSSLYTLRTISLLYTFSTSLLTPLGWDSVLLVCQLDEFFLPVVGIPVSVRAITFLLFPPLPDPLPGACSWPDIVRASEGQRGVLLASEGLFIGLILYV